MILNGMMIHGTGAMTNAPIFHIRPSPSEFIKALSIYIDDLTLCNCSKQGHYIRKGYQFEDCEWCRIEKIMEKENKQHTMMMSLTIPIFLGILNKC